MFEVYCHFMVIPIFNYRLLIIQTICLHQLISCVVNLFICLIYLLYSVPSFILYYYITRCTCQSYILHIPTFFSWYI